MTKRRILIVEDEAILRRIVKDAVEEAGHYVTTAEDGEEALRLFRAERPHLVIADIMLPKLDGFEMVRAMRKEGSNTQYLFLSARSTAEDVVEGFRVGGNDYLRKPFAINELMARVEALLMRLGNDAQSDIYKIGRYEFDCKAQVLTIDGETRHLSTKESALLAALAKEGEKIVSSQCLLMEIWGDDSYYNLRSMNVFVSKLRTYLSKDKSIDISAIRGVGYKLVIRK